MPTVLQTIGSDSEGSPVLAWYRSSALKMQKQGSGRYAANQAQLLSLGGLFPSDSLPHVPIPAPRGLFTLSPSRFFNRKIARERVIESETVTIAGVLICFRRCACHFGRRVFLSLWKKIVFGSLPFGSKPPHCLTTCQLCVTEITPHA